MSQSPTISADPNSGASRVTLYDSSGTELTISQDHTSAGSPGSVRLSDGTSFYKATTPSDTQPISASSLPLPTGAATSALQTAGNSSLSSIDGKIPANLTVTSTRLLVDGSGVTQPVSGTVSISGSVAVTGPLTDAELRASAVPISGTVTANAGTGTFAISAASLPLPTGAATETTLSTLNTKVPSGLTVTSTRLLVDGSGVTQPVSGTVTANAGTGSFTVAQATGTNLHTVVDSGTITANAGTGTFAISAASLPLPTGAATSALQTTLNTSITDGTQVTKLSGDYYSSFQPDFSNVISGTSNIAIDNSGRLETHSTVLTDEGSFRDDFPGSALTTTLTGTLSFTNGSPTLTGTGTSFTTEVKSGQYIKKSADSETLYLQVYSVDSDTQITLVANYAGTTASGVTAVKSNWVTVTPGTGSITVANSLVNVVGGTANNAVTAIYRQGDYLPFNNQFNATISQRIANQTIIIGMVNNVTTPTIQAIIQFTGTSASALSFITSSSSAAADTQTSALTLNGLNTAVSNAYQITLTNNRACLFVNGLLVATHELHLPGSYDNLQMVTKISNSNPVTATTVSLDYVLFYNTDQLDITNNFTGEPLPVLSTPQDGAKFTYGAAITATTVAATPTDVFTITGSATKTVKIRHISIDGTQTTGGVVNILVIKRSTANTGGTSTLPTAVPYDSANPAATAVVRSYTVNPTALGTAVGTIHSEKLFVSATTGTPDELKFDYTEHSPIQPITLRGATEVLAINLNSVTVTGNSFNMDITWTEE